jgi:DNA ligase (NAD+)
MYSKEETTKLQKVTGSLLKELEKARLNDTVGQGVSEKKIDTLRDVLRFHEYRYYILNDPLISDFEYDQLFKALEKIEKENPSLISVDSPTQRVAKGLTKDFPTVQHLVPMLSLDNSYNNEDIVDFDRRARELTGFDKIEYCVEPKFDGASISLIYEDDFLTRGATRGDGVQGDDITINIKQIRTIPLSAKFSKYNLQQIEIRGEVLINKNNFKKYNEQLMEQGMAPLANPRNAASGTLRIKDSTEVKKRNLEAFVYSISDYTLIRGKQVPKELQTHAGCLEMLWELGFRSPQKEKKVLKGIYAVIMYSNEFEFKRYELTY